jgi:DNA-binding transcriptional LysR family regulator
MDIRDLRYVSVAAEALNISRAAEALGLNASTISRRITRLEDELGVTLSACPPIAA